MSPAAITTGLLALVGVAVGVGVLVGGSGVAVGVVTAVLVGVVVSVGVLVDGIGVVVGVALAGEEVVSATLST
jgi:hypothetical protein